MTITCDTPIENLLDVNRIKELVNEYATTVIKEVNELTSTLIFEQKRGLSSEAFIIDNNSILYEKGNTIIEEVSTISEETESWKNDLISKAQEKRKEEIEILKSKVYDKLVELSAEIAKLSFKSILNKSPEITEKQQSLNELYKKYQTKYDQLLSMKE